VTVASLELCRELHDLSGWDNTDYYHAREWDKAIKYPERQVIADWTVIRKYEYAGLGTKLELVCAYDLGYLLRKLPHMDSLNDHWQMWHAVTGEWGIDWEGDEYIADTPENAATKLCIELFKQGVLKRDG
jgi:hypothetical protein